MAKSSLTQSNIQALIKSWCRDVFEKTFKRKTDYREDITDYINLYRKIYGTDLIWQLYLGSVNVKFIEILMTGKTMTEIAKEMELSPYKAQVLKEDSLSRLRKLNHFQEYFLLPLLTGTECDAIRSHLLGLTDTPE